MDIRVRHRVEPNHRIHEHRNNLIDLTSSAEKASQRRPASPDQMRMLFQERQIGNLQIAETDPQNRRQLIELDDNIPVSRPAFRREEIRHHVATPQDQYMHRLHVREYIDEGALRHESGPVQGSYRYPAERRMLYEPVAERQSATQPVRLVADEPMTVVYSGQNAQAYRLNDHEQVHRLPIQPYTAAEPSRRLIVLDTADPMEGVQRTTTSR